MGNFPRGCSTQLVRKKKKKKAHSFEQNIRTSEHAPAFQMKLRASFNIPPANFLTHVTNRHILGSGFSFSPLESLSLGKGPRGPCTLFAHRLAFSLVLGQDISTVDQAWISLVLPACLPFMASMLDSLFWKNKILTISVNVCSRGQVSAWKWFWLNEGWSTG